MHPRSNSHVSIWYVNKHEVREVGELWNEKQEIQFSWIIVVWTYRNMRMYKSRSESEDRWSFVVVDDDDSGDRMGREWSRLRRRIVSSEARGLREEGDITELSDRLNRRFSSKKNSN